LASKAQLAIDSTPATTSVAQADSSVADSNQFVVPSENELAHERRRVARARHNRQRMMAQRLNDDMRRTVLGQTALGYTAEPIAAVGRDRTD